VAQVALFLLSAATLAFEVNLSRIFSVSQFYHFAFMTVSLALLGFGASGTLLSLVPGLGRRPRRTLTACGWGFALAAVGSYGLTLLVPFDSFRVALEPETWGILALHYVALAAPFLFTGLAVGLLLDTKPGSIGRTYAANLTGSAAGCLLAVTFPRLGGAEGVVLLSAGLGVVAATLFSLPPGRLSARPLFTHLLLPAVAALILLALAVQPPAGLEIDLSPYKGLSYALQLPDAEVLFREWNGFSRVDVVAASAIRSLPGQGFACSQEPPAQRGLFVDGDNLSPITRVEEPADLRPVTDCLLPTLAYRLRPGARALVLHPRAGIDVWIALAEGAQAVTAVEPNPLVVRAVASQERWGESPYAHSRVSLFTEEGRAFLARPGPRYDVVLLSLPGTYHPITSGAYSLAEDYRYTVEGLVAGLERLEEDGLMVVTRWLQVPPSESLRAFATVVEAVERTGGDPAQGLVALRSYNQVLILARRGAFRPEEVNGVRAFAAERAFDLVYAPDLQPEEANQHNILPSPDYYRAFTALLAADNREAWLEDYPFDVSPPTDNRPFFGHFFRWEQAREVMAMAGHVWQPFGGAGYLVLLGLLAIGSLAAGVLVLLPLAGRRTKRPATDGPPVLVQLLPFGFLGLGFLFVEIPLLQRFILFLGHPSYAMATVLGALLLFSGVGSLLSGRVRLGVAMGALVGLVLVYQAGLSLFSGPLLRLPLGMRVGVVVLTLAPLGILMGIPFPNSLARLQRETPGLVAWAWGVNGALSVMASILAALIALSWGFRIVMGLGALCYVGMWATMAWATRSHPRWNAPPPPRP
jgi:hypothetical protein